MTSSHIHNETSDRQCLNLSPRDEAYDLKPDQGTKSQVSETVVIMERLANDDSGYLHMSTREANTPSASNPKLGVARLFRSSHNENIPPPTAKGDSKPASLTRKAPLQANPSEGMDPVDLQDSRNPQRVSCYAQEITVNLYEAEGKFMSAPEYMSSQQDINYKMRAILID
jgi:hypothetical protein